MQHVKEFKPDYFNPENVKQRKLYIVTEQSMKNSIDSFH